MGVSRSSERGAPWSDAESLRFARATVADLRSAYGRYPSDAGMRELVTEVLALSPQFAQMWSEHEVETRRPLMKRFIHPMAGPLEFECQILHVGDTGQRLIVYCAAPGSATLEAFRRLAAAGGSPYGPAPADETSPSRP
jgi:transcription regulator MmyB-like protein